MYELFFERATHRGTGFAFPCDEEGYVSLLKLTPHQVANYSNCISNKWGEYLPPVVRLVTPVL